MTRKHPNPGLFWVSFAVMLVAGLTVGFAIGVTTQQWAAAFVIQMLLAVVWVTFFYGYRPARWRSTNRA